MCALSEQGLLPPHRACRVSIIHPIHSCCVKKRNYVTLWKEKPDLPPNKGKCEYDKAFASETQPSNQPSVIIISGT